MTVERMRSSLGNKVANQSIITDKGENGFTKTEVFQSYGSEIAIKEYEAGKLVVVYLDCNKWDYSKTTGKYRNIFLGENKAETQKKIDSGEYILTDLN